MAVRYEHIYPEPKYNIMVELLALATYQNYGDSPEQQDFHNQLNTVLQYFRDKEVYFFISEPNDLSYTDRIKDMPDDIRTDFRNICHFEKLIERGILPHNTYVRLYAFNEYRSALVRDIQLKVRQLKKERPELYLKAEWITGHILLQSEQQVFHIWAHQPMDNIRNAIDEILDE